ncbi:deoxyribonuclease IV [Pseudactinotalea sp. Z1739]|uniref:deoxyribonuclease IV n=1 Tax=Pseudactinotalea sp. Z1739 TaxID=3413028 RepID=UPI003C7C7606
MTQLVGAHAGQDDPIGYAREVGADLVQIFLGDPQKWSAPSAPHPDGADGLRRAAQQAGIALVVHAPYVLNVASLNNRIRIPSRKLLAKVMDLAGQIEAIGVVVHGGHVRAEDDPEVGFDNWRKAIEQTPKPVPILIENTAGGNHSMARGVERIARLWESVSAAEGSEQVGFCLDTAHAFAGGEELDGLTDRIRAITGRIDLVHLNNSLGAFNSGQDRHAGIHAADGLIEPGALGTLAAAAKSPVVLETPGAGHAEELTWVREQVR